MSDSSNGDASYRDFAPDGNDDAGVAGAQRVARDRDPLFLGIAAICDTATRVTGVDGAALAVLTTARGIRELVHATDAVAQPLDELQFVLGEGPCLDAYQRVEPQMCAHIDDDEFQQRWLAFTAELATLGVLAVFAYPVPGELRPMGVLELYRHTSGPLSEPEHQSAQLCAAALRTTLEKNWREHLQRSISEDAALDAIAEQAGPRRLRMRSPDSRYTSRRGWWRCSWGLPPAMRSTGCGRTRMRRTGPCSHWPPMWSLGDCHFPASTAMKSSTHEVDR